MRNTSMKKSLLSIVTASVMLAGVGLASAQTTATTTTTWTDSYGNTIREYSTTQKVKPIEDKSINVTVGGVLPGTVEIHPLPPTIKVDKPEMYSYTIINNKPVVVERASRRVVHVW
jgi:hypothetical protein